MPKLLFAIICSHILTFHGCLCMPDILKKCYDDNSKLTTPKKNCFQQYLLHRIGDKSNNELDKDALNWINSLGQKLHTRAKRQTREGGVLRIRQEIRTLSDYQRYAFFNALHDLKFDTSVYPNKYDAIALLHQGDATKSAHGGPNFVGWHRYYLYILEEALRTKNENVTIPYWDSRIDYRMPDPADSILWTETFFGNGKGVIYTGPFAEWKTPSNNTLLRRNIGEKGSLINPEKFKNVFRQCYTDEILPPTPSDDLNDLEAHHGQVHIWVGGRDGHMSGLPTSAMDPVFFMHHAFVDFMWEKFRNHQRKIRIIPETDYPAGPKTNQQPNRTMANLLPQRKSIWGYSNYFIPKIYEYADVPECSNNCGDGNDIFIYCNKTINACVSRSRHYRLDFGIPVPIFGRSGESISFGGAGGDTFMSPENADLTRGNVAPDMSEMFTLSLALQDRRTQSNVS